MSLSPARQHRLRVQAEQAAREGGSVQERNSEQTTIPAPRPQ